MLTYSIANLKRKFEFCQSFFRKNGYKEANRVVSEPAHILSRFRCRGFELYQGVLLRKYFEKFAKTQKMHVFSNLASCSCHDMCLSGLNVLCVIPLMGI